MIQHDLDQWVAQLDRAASKAPDEAAKVVEKGAHNIKTDAARRVSGLAHAPAYPKAITYDVYRFFGGPVAEVGPDKGKRQGALGNILEHGTVKNAPIPHMAPAADKELPRFEKAMSDLGVSLVEKR